MANCFAKHKQTKKKSALKSNHVLFHLIIDHKLIINYIAMKMDYTRQGASIVSVYLAKSANDKTMSGLVLFNGSFAFFVNY